MGEYRKSGVLTQLVKCTRLKKTKCITAIMEERIRRAGCVQQIPKKRRSRRRPQGGEMTMLNVSGFEGNLVHKVGKISRWMDIHYTMT